MDIENLQTFIRVAENKSFSRSAAEMNLTQPAISKRIATLETQLDARLFDRAGRTVHLTEAGRILLPGAKQIQSEVSRIEDVLKSTDENISGNLAIGTTAYVATTQLSPVLTRFKDLFNDVTIELVLDDTETTLQKVLDNSLELALCPLHRGSLAKLSDALHCAEVFSGDLKFVVARNSPLARCEEVTAGKLTASSAILPSRDTLAGRAIDSELARFSIEPEVAVHADDFATMRSLAAIGFGWTCVPEYELDDSLAVLQVSDVKLPHTVTLVRRREHTLSRAAEAFMGSLPVSQGRLLPVGDQPV